jgi:hypothetical protein
MAKALVTALSLSLAGALATQSASAGSTAINDCLIVAAKAQYQLSPTMWSRLLVVRYDAYRLQHVYLVYAVGPGEILSFDSVHGTQRHHTDVRTASALARIVDPRAAWGWYVEENANNRNLLAQQR